MTAVHRVQLVPDAAGVGLYAEVSHAVHTQVSGVWAVQPVMAVHCTGGQGGTGAKVGLGALLDARQSTASVGCGQCARCSCGPRPTHRAWGRRRGGRRRGRRRGRSRADGVGVGAVDAVVNCVSVKRVWGLAWQKAGQECEHKGYNGSRAHGMPAAVGARVPHLWWRSRLRPRRCARPGPRLCCRTTRSCMGRGQGGRAGTG